MGKSGEIYERLRTDILGGRLTPGQRLKFPDLCARYGTSVGAAREALTRLVTEGLVASQSNHGFTVVSLSYGDLAELTSARREVEPLVFAMAVREGDMAWEAAVVAAHHVLARTPFFGEGSREHPSAEWSAAHTAFHLALLEGCPNRRLRSIACGLREEAELYRTWAVSYGRESEEEIALEHRGLLDAVVERDALSAAERLRHHISHTARLLIRGATDTPA
ncbi:MAG: GntR family transcriptional regulator [Thermoactinospora sp.]|nr:GntR family transcriptional regulator [Thermoactinospora sp.]